MDLGNICSDDEVTRRYDFLQKLQSMDSRCDKMMCYVDRCAKLEELVAMYRNLMCSHFISLIKLLLEKPNVIQFEEYLSTQLQMLEAVLNYNK